MNIVWDGPTAWVVDKPAGVNVIPGRSSTEGRCLRDALSEFTGQQVWVVHRLDRDTSGLVLFAKTAQSHQWYNHAFENREVEKIYWAAVSGIPRDTSGVVTAPLREFGSGRMGVDPEGKPSETHYAVWARSSRAALLRVSPRSGRRHQIRVHLNVLGHPVLGDPWYGPPPRPVGGAPRLLLHAGRLTVRQPDGSTLRCESDPGPDFEQALRVVGFPQISYRGENL